MTITEIKQYIIDNNKLEYILSEIGCHHIKYHNKGYYTCANKDGDNKTAINIYNNENLTCINHTRKMSKDNKFQDLFTLIMYNKNLTFPQANKYLHKLLQLEYSFKPKNKQEEKDPLEIFKKVKTKHNIVNVKDIEIYDESIIKEYILLPHIDWIRNDGIMPWTCEKFRIGYSADRKRIVIPHRWWCGDENEFVGVIGRTVIKEYEMLDIQKYLPLKAYPKSLNLYGLQENYQSIQEAGYVVVYEAEKSTLKRHSRNDKTGVSICCQDMSNEQVKILIGLNVDIIIVFDKGVPLEHIRATCDKFYMIRVVYYIYDKYDLLKDKESPADSSNKIFDYLFKYKTLYDENEHKKYLNYLKEHNGIN